MKSGIDRMTEQERFELENEDGTICIRDNIRKKYIFTFVCEDIDMEEGMLEECEKVVNCLNQTWEQTQRFEKHNQELIQRNIKYEDKIDELKNENKQLKEKEKRYKHILQDLGVLVIE